MTMCAIGGIIATLVLPKVLKYIGMVNMYYLSSFWHCFVRCGISQYCHHVHLYYIDWVI